MKCSPGSPSNPKGTEALYDETVDFDLTLVNGGGGFSQDDTNVALLVSNPGLLGSADDVPHDDGSRVITTPVQTTQIAPTILSIFGIDPGELQAVQKEHTTTLPALGLSAS